MRITFRKTIFAVLVIIGVPLSIFFALGLEGEALQHSLERGTPGLVIGHLLYPPASGGLELLGKQMHIELAVDATILFLLICSAAFLIAKYRRKHNGPTATNIRF